MHAVERADRDRTTAVGSADLGRIAPDDHFGSDARVIGSTPVGGEHDGGLHARAAPFVDREQLAVLVDDRERTGRVEIAEQRGRRERRAVRDRALLLAFHDDLRQVPQRGRRREDERSGSAAISSSVCASSRPNEPTRRRRSSPRWAQPPSAVPRSAASVRT